MINRVKALNTIKQARKKSLKGMTLIELMVVVAIVAILAGVAFPAYTNYVDRANRADAQGALLAFSNAMERYAALNPNTGYADAAVGDSNSGAPKMFDTEAPLSGNDKTYDLTLVVVPDGDGYANNYILTATPKGKMATDDCGAFTLTNIGTRNITGTDVGCWK